MSKRQAAKRLLFGHNVPDTEPPIGTVAEFSWAFRNGLAYTTGLMVRLDTGWATSSKEARIEELRTWAELTDPEVINARLRLSNPETKLFVSTVDVNQAVPTGLLYAVWNDGEEAGRWNRHHEQETHPEARELRANPYPQPADELDELDPEGNLT
jgi:hypothetical protein